MSDKPRKWWVYSGAKGWVIFKDELTTSGVPGIRVIEYSAYEQVCAERDTIQSQALELNEMNERNNWQLLKERDAALADVNKLICELKARDAEVDSFRRTNHYLENIELRAELQKVRDENEKMMECDYWYDRYKTALAERDQSDENLAELRSKFILNLQWLWDGIGHFNSEEDNAQVRHLQTEIEKVIKTISF